MVWCDIKRKGKGYAQLPVRGVAKGHQTLFFAHKALVTSEAAHRRRICVDHSADLLND